MHQPHKNIFIAYVILAIVLTGLFSQALSATEHSLLESVHKENFELSNEVGTGTFLMRSDRESVYQVASLLSTQASVSISGPVATTEITQTFINTGIDFSESFYVFPLPEDAAVEYMAITVGERRIIGQIMEKAEAKKVYTQAKRQGKRAALVQQSRPNLFKTSVANIPAGEKISVTLRINQSLSIKSDVKNNSQKFEYRLPLTLTPRYQAPPLDPDLFSHDATSHDSFQHSKTQDNFRSIFKANKVNQQNSVDDEHIYPLQVQKQNSLGIKNSINVQVMMHNMRYGQEVGSRNQKIEQKVIDDVRYINFAHSNVVMDQDFVINWSINESNVNQAQIFTQTVDGSEYGLLMISPPEIISQQAVLPREVIFIIDSSGSMGGESMRQAKESLLFALDNLAIDERFNIIDFDSRFHSLYSNPKIANEKNIEKAIKFVTALTADGGTNMAPALASALNMKTEKNFLKQVIFITDGAVSNEAQLFSLLHDKIGKSRLFTVGIGSAPNSYFMRKAAEFGRGSFTYIGSIEEVRPQMSGLFKKIGSPVLRDIELIFPEGVKAEKWPEYIPDLYAGEPVVIPIRFEQRPEWVTLKGKSDHPWEQTVVVNQTQQNSGISSLWARKKIEALMDKLIRGASEEKIKPQILEVALTHHLLSKYTSFVAVDESVVRKQQNKLKTGQVPNLLPKGNNYPSTAAGVKFWSLLSIIALLFSMCLQNISMTRKQSRIV